MALFPITGFPLEVYEVIIDCLSGDTTALKACSLTCRAFVCAARPHIFRSVKLSTMSDAQKLVRLLDRSDRANSGLHIYMRDVWIGPPLGTDRSRWTGNISWQDTMIPAILPRLVSVERLILVGLSWRRKGLWEKACTMSLSSTVRVLYLVDLTFMTPAEVHSLLLSFPCLHFIRAMSLNLLNQLPMAVAAPSKPTIQLTTLSITSLVGKHAVRDVSVLVHGLLLAPFDFRLGLLDWGSQLTEEDITLLGCVLHRSGPNLRKLFIHLEWTERVEAYATLLDSVLIGSNTNLTTVCLGCCTTRLLEQQSIKPGAWIPVLLNQITSAHMLSLRSIQIDLRYTRAANELPRHISHIDWDALDHTLLNLAAYASPQLKVHFLLGRESHPECSDASEGIRAHLPRARASRIPLIVVTTRHATTPSSRWGPESVSYYARRISESTGPIFATQEL